MISAGPGVPASTATSSLSPVERRPSSSAASAAFLLELGHAVNALRSIPAVEETNNWRVPDLTAGGVRYSSWWWWIDGEAAVSSPRYINVNASEARMMLGPESNSDSGSVDAPPSCLVWIQRSCEAQVGLVNGGDSGLQILTTRPKKFRLNFWNVYSKLF